ncbi:hypothetical protein [Fluviispira multicolorata]|uniref:Uncharacterized protein n=1 Tax=Fluviispira multicolorata TaxID=2654512 RepID=A0A833JDV0_9BACT|nr:hypothetical protein [Fluviispira multicolorata]KAB8029100.1 hypothetical protein GCL57_11205 [Fluviispira multicolorata]
MPSNSSKSKAAVVGKKAKETSKNKKKINAVSNFSTPAFIEDLTGAAQQELNFQWNINANAFTEQSITGDPWNQGYLDDTGKFIPTPIQSYYYNLSTTPIPQNTQAPLVPWIAFPHRIIYYLGKANPSTNIYNLEQQKLFELADTGYYTNSSGTKQTFPKIPVNLCPKPNWQGEMQEYGPYGPRGWQDEYCEWSVTRNSSGKITRVDFVCENPEYWYTLWRVDPNAVAKKYEETLNFGLHTNSQNLIKINIEDLYLNDPLTGKPVIDPYTNKPAYNPLNKWNKGPVSQRGSSPSGGAMHLTSSPNSLQTEVGLAGCATVQRKVGNVDSQALICCSKYGQSFRNSDPIIGQSVNQVVEGPPASRVSLANPIGLYIQKPDFTNYELFDDPKLPVDAQVSDCWQVIRGHEILIDPITNAPFNGNFILHAAFQIPEKWIAAGVTKTISDIKINSEGVSSPIQWAGQIALTFHVGLYARPLPAAELQPVSCLVSLDNPTSDKSLPPAQAQPVQMMYQTLWNAYYGTKISNPVGVPMNLATNTVIVPVPVRQGDQGLKIALICNTAVTHTFNTLPSVTASNSNIEITVDKKAGLQDVTYAAPGNSYPDVFKMLTLTVNINKNVPPGLYGIQVKNPGKGMPDALIAPGFINVLPAKQN